LLGEFKVEDKRTSWVKWALPPAFPSVFAVDEAVTVVLDTVRFLTDPNSPFHVIGDTIVQIGGSHSVDPDDIVI
jgi:hypothetical protein